MILEYCQMFVEDVGDPYLHVFQKYLQSLSGPQPLLVNMLQHERMVDKAVNTLDIAGRYSKLQPPTDLRDEISRCFVINVVRIISVHNDLKEAFVRLGRDPDYLSTDIDNAI